MSDPYAELGVDRDATDEQIKGAYRKRAKKAHPDAGGSAEEFGSLSRAMAVLSDPARRKKFDETGTVDDGPNNESAAAFEMIVAFMQGEMAKYANSGFKPNLDPRQRDLIAEFRQKTIEEIAANEAKRETFEKTKALIIDMARRFKGKKKSAMIRRAIKSQAEQFVKAIAAADHHISRCRASIEMVDGIDFERDAPMPPTAGDWGEFRLDPRGGMFFR